MNRRCNAFATRCDMAACLLAATVALLAGCTSLHAPQTPVPEEKEPVVLKRDAVPKAEVPDDSPLLVDEVAPETAEVVEEQSVFPERRQDDTPRVKISEYPSTLIKGMKDPDEKVQVWLNLDATALTEVVPLFAHEDLLNFSYLIDPSVKGAVTMTVDSEMTAREAWEMFEHLLWLAGAYASKNPGFIHIMPFAKMPKERRLLAKHEPLANVEVSFIPIMYVKSSEIIANIKPFMTDGATVTDLPSSNTLLIVEAPANMQKLRELISRLDTKAEASWPHICLQCHEVDVEVVLEELTALLPVLGLPVTNKGPSGGQIKITAIPRLQAIVASAAIKDVLDEVERWCRVLDREDQAEKENIFFYNVQHSTASQLSQMLGVFFNTSASTSGRPSRTKSTSAKTTAPAGTKSPSTPTISTTATRRAGDEGPSQTIFDTPVIMYVDEIQNRLTIKTTHRAYALVKALLERQDLPQRQVMIEAVIADITLDERTEFGFAYAAQHTDKAGMGISNAGSWLSVSDAGVINRAAEIVDAQAISEGAAVGFVKGDKVAFINAVAGKTNVKVLSAPQIMAASGEEAVINVGRRVSIRTSEYGDNDVYSRATYQYEDTGTILTVTPQITAGNEVRLDIKQEVSSVVEDTRADDKSPDISNKQLNTTLIIPDGATVMMGGLIDTSTSDGHTGVPGLKDIPWLGVLFRTHTTTNTRHELLVLITVHVIDRASGTQQLMQRYREALTEIKSRLNG